MEIARATGREAAIFSSSADPRDPLIFARTRKLMTLRNSFPSLRLAAVMTAADHATRNNLLLSGA
jgi:hypothetical protein